MDTWSYLFSLHYWIFTIINEDFSFTIVFCKFDCYFFVTFTLFTYVWVQVVESIVQKVRQWSEVQQNVLIMCVLWSTIFTWVTIPQKRFWCSKRSKRSKKDDKSDLFSIFSMWSNTIKSNQSSRNRKKEKLLW